MSLIYMKLALVFQMHFQIASCYWKSRDRWTGFKEHSGNFEEPLRRRLPEASHSALKGLILAVHFEHPGGELADSSCNRPAWFRWSLDAQDALVALYPAFTGVAGSDSYEARI
jgi:hypothetical protein